MAESEKAHTGVSVSLLSSAVAESEKVHAEVTMSMLHLLHLRSGNLSDCVLMFTFGTG